MHPALAKYDDLTVVGRDLTDASGFTLTALVHDEMHFLPPFLDHYRRLGVERFVFIDDRSTDGTAEFLAVQPDVMVLQSSYRFGDKVDMVDAQALGSNGMRHHLIWRMLLLQKYARGNWSLHLDADEFLDLPPGLSISDFCQRLGKDGESHVWAVMLDLYPESLATLYAMADDKVIDFEKDWFFDGRRHLRLRANKRPKVVYAGSRARLMQAHGLNPKQDWFHRTFPWLGRQSPARFNAIRKPVLLRWADEMQLLSAHIVSGRAVKEYLLPLRHYKFNGAIAARISWALETGGYSGGSAEYKALEQLFLRMQQNDPNFIEKVSMRYAGFHDFVRTHNAEGFD